MRLSDGDLLDGIQPQRLRVKYVLTDSGPQWRADFELDPVNRRVPPWYFVMLAHQRKTVPCAPIPSRPSSRKKRP